jgi:hypothetical protein
MRIVKVKKGSSSKPGRYAGYGPTITNWNIRQMLIQHGLTPKQIKVLQDKKLILMSPGALSRKLKHSDELFIIDLEEKVEAPKSLDRFGDINLE